MSSHHIVRDEQEPALIVIDIEEIDPFHGSAISSKKLEDIGQLLEWSPMVVGVKESLNQLITLGIKIDLAVIPPEEIGMWEEVLQYQQPIKILKKNGNSSLLLNEIIEYLIDKGHYSFHVLSNKLTLFEFINLHQQYGNKADIIYINNEQKISVAKSGSFYKWLNKGERISILPLDENTYLSTEGFLNNIKNEMVQSEFAFEVAEEGAVKIETNLKPFLVAEGL